MPRGVRGMTDFGQRHRVAVGISGWLVGCVLIAWALAGRWDELWAAAGRLSIGLAVLTIALQLVALVARGEAWLHCLRGAGGTVDRRRVYRASGLGCAANVLSASLGTAARITILRRSARTETPAVGALVAAELPILVVEGVLAGIFSFTLVGPLGLPWWTPILCVVVTVAIGAGLAAAGRPTGRGICRGLAVLRANQGRAKLIGFVLVAVVAQIARNWLMLRTVGVEASVFDAIAVLIAVVILGQLPIGPGVGAGAAVLILGPQGVVAAAAAGILLTATGTIGGLLFGAWAASDRVYASRQVAARRRAHEATVALHQAIARLPSARRRIVETAYFGGLSSVQISRTLGLPALAL
ncbi:MAG: hypothetical protein QOG77_3929 [Solirubrobacteraceae bacterium]|nr:hypothetical protein [Solirubrobacteraceae bacterium]